MQAETFEIPADYVDPYQKMLADFVSDVEAKVRNGDTTLEVALSESAGSEFATEYGLSKGYIGKHVRPENLEADNAPRHRM